MWLFFLFFTSQKWSHQIYSSATARFRTGPSCQRFIFQIYIFLFPRTPDRALLTLRSSRMPYSVPPPHHLPPVLHEQSYVENEQEYHGYQRGKYLFPCGEVRTGSSISIIISNGEPLTQETVQNEADRMDIYHKLFLVARQEKLHNTPLVFSPDSKLRVLDLGTGTGIWAIDMAL